MCRCICCYKLRACACTGVSSILAVSLTDKTVMQFARLYPLNQLDLPVEKKHVDFGPLLGSGVKVENPSRDYTPPSEFTLSAE